MREIPSLEEATPSQFAEFVELARRAGAILVSREYIFPRETLLALKDRGIHVLMHDWLPPNTIVAVDHSDIPTMLEVAFVPPGAHWVIAQ